jgi:hypothetical protein
MESSGWICCGRVACLVSCGCVGCCCTCCGIRWLLVAADVSSVTSCFFPLLCPQSGVAPWSCAEVNCGLACFTHAVWVLQLLLQLWQWPTSPDMTEKRLFQAAHDNFVHISNEERLQHCTLLAAIALQLCRSSTPAEKTQRRSCADDAKSY